MRIAVFHNLPSGGAKRALFEYVKRLKADNHKIDLYVLVTANEFFLDLRKLVDNFFVYKYKRITSRKRPWSYLMFLTNFWDLFFLSRISRKIAHDVDAEKYDLVFVANCQITHNPYILRYLKTKSVIYSQEPPRMIYESDFDKIQMAGRNKLFSLFTRILLKPYYHFLKIVDRKNLLSANLILVNSKFSQNIFKTVYGVETKVVYLGVDANKFNCRTNIVKENMVFLVGGLNPIKGQDFVLRSIALLEKKPKVVFAGYGMLAGEKERLEEFAKINSIDLECKMKLSDNELVDYYNKAKITLAAAHKEPFGFTVIESLSCKTPVIAVSEGGFKETVKNGQNGFLVNRNEKAFGDAIMRLLHDDLLLMKLGDNGRKYVENNFTWSNSYTCLKNYISLLASKNY